MSEAGTLINKHTSGFIRTPPTLAERIGKHLFSFPGRECSVYDPTSGEGDFFCACAHAPQAQLFGTEISEERVTQSRERWPHATILTTAVEAVSIKGSMQLIVSNPPYFYQNGQRAAYSIIKKAGLSLQPGGVHAAIVTARSDWTAVMVNHWLTWYANIRIWKFPDAPDSDESFDRYKQILIVGVRRATPAIPEEADRLLLLRFQWKEARTTRDGKRVGFTGWAGGEAPPDIPDVPLADPYVIPASHTSTPPHLTTSHASDELLLTLLDDQGAHLSTGWQKATTWPERGYVAPPMMPFSGEGHLAAEILTGTLDGEIVHLENHGYLFSAFLSKAWHLVPVDAEYAEKLRQDGCLRVELRQRLDDPMLGVLHLDSGETRYYQGTDVFTYLAPLLPTLAARVTERRPPRYQLAPTDWELSVLTQFGTDKRLPKAPHAGLVAPQIHRICAMAWAQDATGRGSIQGEPGTGKTRIGSATGVRHAYRWRHRATVPFQHQQQAGWIRRLRRAWLKNPRTLALLDLEPVVGRRVAQGEGEPAAVVVDASTQQVVAYREKSTGNLLAPEHAGPRAFPLLVVTPLKVTKEYRKEVQAAFPQAEVIHLETHRDLPRFLGRCATSTHPMVVGILSHSLSRAFGREWREAVQSKTVTVQVPELDPPKHLLDQLEEIFHRGRSRTRRIGYRFKAEPERLLTRVSQVEHFFCPACNARLEVTVEGNEGAERIPVTSRTWLRARPRDCSCLNSARRQDQAQRLARKRLPKEPLWQVDWVASTRRKHPRVPFAEWSRVIDQVWHQDRDQITQEQQIQMARRDPALLEHLVNLALVDCTRLSPLLTLVSGSMRQATHQLQQAHTALIAWLEHLPNSEGIDPVILTTSASFASLADLAVRDPRSCLALMQDQDTHEAALQQQVGAILRLQQMVAQKLLDAVRRDGSSLLLRALLESTAADVNWSSRLFATRMHQMNPSHRAMHLVQEVQGPILVETLDREAVTKYEAVKDIDNRIVEYRLGKRVLVPLYHWRSRQIIGYAHDSQPINRQTRYRFGPAPKDSFDLTQYLFDAFRGCIALTIVDESHIGRGRRTDVAHMHHLAMCSAQLRELTSGTHFGGDLLGFFHYWYRYCPEFFRSRGYGWNDAQAAQADLGVMQEWVKEYPETESEARRGSGKTDLRVTTEAGPGFSTALLPDLVADLAFLTVLDVGQYMPPKIEIPKGIWMNDPLLMEKRQEADAEVAEAEAVFRACKEAVRTIQEQPEARPPDHEPQAHAALDQARAQLQAAQLRHTQTLAWIKERDLAAAYTEVAGHLQAMAQAGSEAARLALGTIPRWFSSLPCSQPYQLKYTRRNLWGERQDSDVILETAQLAWDYLYPMERWLRETVERELAEGRRVLLYTEQNAIRSMADRLAWVLKDFDPWILPNDINPEDRQQAILDASKAGARVFLAPYKRIDVGLNLQSAIDTIIWAELPQNLYFFIQASQRIWRLGKKEECRIYIPFYIGTEAHKKVRNLGQRDGAAAAFAGEPIKGGLSQHAGAHENVLAKLSAHLEEMGGAQDDRAEIEASFARRNAELAEALHTGRAWFGLVDSLPERLLAHLAEPRPDVWAEVPALNYLREVNQGLPETSVEIEQTPADLPFPWFQEEPPDEAHAVPGRSLEPPPPMAFPVPVPANALPPPVVPPSTQPDSVPGPFLPDRSMPASTLPLPVPTASVAESSSSRQTTWTFGKETDIQRVRKHPPRRTMPRLKNPVTETIIPALEPLRFQEADHKPKLAQVSVWDGIDLHSHL